MKSVSHLVRTFVPDHYELSLALNRPERTFEGTVTIHGAIIGTPKDLRLHAKDLAVHSATIDGKSAEFSHEADDELVLNHHDITEGAHIVVVQFSGAITDGMHGLYPCYYEYDGKKQELLTTQFESHHAREVFPCVDEPKAKATFDVTLTTEPDVTVLSNMPLKTQRTENDRLISEFETTPHMSSYLLAWVVGNLHKKSARTKSGVEVNVWATPAQPTESLDFALGIAARTLDYFDDYFDVPYPLPKSDHVALPDFAHGAMENWGLITYRELALLVDPKTASLERTHMAATVIAHELSHQWFGNLVTMKWWNDLWLNESFANMMEFLAVDALEPTWNIWLDHASGDALSALRRDGLDGVQAIRTDVHHPDQIDSVFDPSIVYAKGGRLLRMLQTYLGDEKFRKGLGVYFKKYAYQNTEADDLWKAMSEAAGQDIGAFMHTWINQSGYPVLHVTKQGQEVTLRQERFFVGPHEPAQSIWPIPLNSTCSEMPKLLDSESVTVTRHHTSLLRFNAGATAHFITHYDDGLRKEILENLQTLPAIDRLYFLFEQIILAQAGILSVAEIIPVLQQYGQETEEAVWAIMSLAINELRKFVETDKAAESKLRAFVGALVSKEYKRLGWDAQPGEPEPDTRLRSLIIMLALYSEQPDVIAEALKRYSQQGVDGLDPELRASIMATAVRSSGSDTIIDDLVVLYPTINDSEVRDDVCNALTSTKDITVIKRLAALLKDGSTIRTQDAMHWLLGLLRNRYGRSYIWQWIRDEWVWAAATFKKDKHYDMVPRYIASCLLTPEQLKEYIAFFTPHLKDIALKHNIGVGITELKGRVALLERDGDAVRKALLDLKP